MKRVILGILLMVALITTVVGVNLLAGSGAEAQAPTHLALVVWDSSSPNAQSDALEVTGELRNLGWTVTAQAISYTFTGFQNQVKDVWGEPGANSLPKLLFYSGHGYLSVDRPGGVVQDEPAGTDHSMCNTLNREIPPAPPECDENLNLNPTGTDEKLATLFSGYTGMKAFIFDTCFSGGLFDGEADLNLLSNSLVMAACSSNEKASWFYHLSHGHRHGHFSFHLINGLKGAARYGDNTITFGELYAYAEGRIQYWNSLLGPLGLGQNPRRWPSSTDPIWTQVVGYTTQSPTVDDEPDEDQAGTACDTCLGPDCPTGGVGGIAELPEAEGHAVASQSRSWTPRDLALAGMAAAAGLVLAAGTWYARRHWLRRRA